MATFNYPTAEEICNALLLDGGLNYENSPIHIFSSETASYYNCNIINYGKVTLKVCLNTSDKEFGSFRRSQTLHSSYTAFSLVVEPKFYFKFGEDKVCYVYAQFIPFHLDVGSGIAGKDLSTQLRKLLKEIMSSLSFFIQKGGHGRLNDKSVCRVVICDDKAMLTDMSSGWPPKSPKDDFNDLGLFLENVAISSWGSANIPRDMGFLITQLKNVIFPKPDIYGYYPEHPLFYSGRKKLVLYMFGSVESEVIIALKAKGKQRVPRRGSPSRPPSIDDLRLQEENVLEQLLQAQLSLLGSHPCPSAGPSAGPSVSPSTTPPSIPPTTASLASPSAAPPSIPPTTASLASPSAAPPSIPPTTASLASPSAAPPSIPPTTASLASPSTAPPSIPPTIASLASPSAAPPSIPRARASLASPSKAPSPTSSPSISQIPQTSSTSTNKYSWENVYNIHTDIERVYTVGKNEGAKYEFSKALDYLRFVRNVYAHIVSQSQLNENSRNALFEEVDKMWPGFVFALFATLVHENWLLNG